MNKFNMGLKKTHEELSDFMTSYLSKQNLLEEEAIHYQGNKSLWGRRLLKNKDIQEILNRTAQEVSGIQVSLIIYSDLAQKGKSNLNSHSRSTLDPNSSHEQSTAYIEELARLEEQYNKYTQSTMQIMKRHLKKIDSTISNYYSQDTKREDMIFSGLKAMQLNPPK